MPEFRRDPEPLPPGGAIPAVRKVPGCGGFIFSPYNNKLVDVSGFPDGLLVTWQTGRPRVDEGRFDPAGLGHGMPASKVGGFGLLLGCAKAVSSAGVGA